MSWLSLAPPIIVFILGFLTKRITSSLFIGVFFAALIACDFSLFQAAWLVAYRLIENVEITRLLSPATFTSAGNFFILSFVLMLGILIEMIRQSHAADAFVRATERSIKDKKTAETSSLLLSHCLCIDDYLSSLTVGSVMRHITDKFRIPRAKLAFLTDSMAAPVAMIAPVSSWAAAIIGFLMDNGVNPVAENDTLLLANPYSVYLNILPYIFYSLTLIISVWAIVRWQISYGAMAKHEEIAEREGNLMGGKEESSAFKRDTYIESKKATLKDFLIPILSLFSAAAFFLLYCGNWELLGGTHSLIEALQRAPISLVLFLSGLTALAITISYYLYDRTFSIRQIIFIAYDGLKLMLPVVAILLFSWTLGSLLRRELQTGQWLASLMAGSIPVVLIPLILFWNASLISLALGSSWATTAILLPIALPMVMAMLGIEAPAKLEQLPIFFPVCGAILSGAVCGDHISLISETTVMAATSAHCNHMEHVKTQLHYALPTFIGCSLAFLLSGFLLWAPSWLLLSCCMGLSLSVSLSLLYLFDKKQAAETIPLAQRDAG